MYGIIYVITNNVNDKKYVGLTTKTIEARFKQHQRTANRGSKYPIHCAIRKYGIENFTYDVIQECSTFDELNAAEIDWIAKLCTIEQGYNICEGGRGVRGTGIWVHSEDAKRKISIGNSGKVRSQETKKKISESVKRIMTKDHRLKCTLGLRTPEARKKIEENNYAKRRKPVYRYSTFGTYLGSFTCCRDAGKRCEANASNILQCCHGRIPTVHDSFWSFVPLDDNDIKRRQVFLVKYRKRCAVAAIKDDVVVGIFTSAKITARFGFSPQQVKRSIKGSCRDHKGYTWKKVAKLSDNEQLQLLDAVFCD